jgi:hypothetical protein
MEENQSSLFQLNLDAQNSYTLRSTASWAKVLGVVSIILAGLFLILGVMAQSASRSYRYGSYRRSSAFDAEALGGMGLAVMVIMALIYGAGGFFALTAGNKINQGLKTNNMEALNAGFANARNFFALWAILVIISLLFMLLGILGNM